MYALKIENGKERIRVRSYASAFIPSYTSAAEESMGKRLFVVPGYIFLPKMISGAEKVPAAEWNVIEALSDSHPSTFNTKTKQITDGPLSGLLILRVNPALKSVCIRAKLLGVTRDYWLAVRFSTPTDIEKAGREEKKPGGDGDGKAANVVELKDSNAGEVKKMAKATYTEEEINAAIELAKEIGIHKAAKELGLPWQAVMSAAKKAGVEITPKVSKKKKAAPKSKPESTAPEPATSTPAKTNAGKNDAEKNGAGKNAVEEKPVEKPKRGRKNKAVYEVVPTPAVEEPAIEPIKDKKEEKAGAMAASELEIENAVLRKENEQLKAKIEKLQKALADLI